MKQKWWSPKTLLLAGLVMFGSFYIALVVHPVAFADYAPTNGKCEDGSDAVTSTKPGTTEKQQTCGDSTKKSSGDQSAGQSKSSVDNSNSTCAIEKMGWIICPLIETVGKIGDRAFGFLADNFLRTEPELVSNSNYGTKAAWEMARSIANIVFIIALLVIIYSQVTGAGINNYGIKKMLPRLIVAAIAVNLSYYICQGMVDLSNILGYEIKAFLVNTSKAISTYAAMPPAGSILGSTDSPGALQTIIGYGLGVASLAWFLLPLMFMSAGSIVIICVVIIIILLLRKAFIVLLVVVSPVAFVLYLLPNTERYFRKWASMLWQLLMVFPVVALLFGSGQLASAIILASGAGAQSDQNSAYYSGKDAKCIQLPQYTTDGTGNVTGTASGAAIKDCGSNSTSLMLGLIAAGIAVAPLFAVISVLKGALAAAGAIGGKISGAVEQGTGKLGAWGTKNTAIGRGMAARQAIKQNYKDQKFAERMAGGGGLRGRYTRVASRGVTGNLGRLSGAPGSMKAQSSKLDANFAGAAQKIEDQEVNDMSNIFEQKGLTSSDLQTLATGGTVQGMSGGVAQKAAIKAMVDQQDIGAMESIAKTNNADALKYLARQIDKNFGAVKMKAAHMVEGGFMSSLKSGQQQSDASLDAAMGRQIQSINPELMATQKGNSLARMNNVMSSTTGGMTSAEVAAHTAAGTLAGEVASRKTATSSNAGRLRANQQLFDKMDPTSKGYVNSW